MDIKWDTPHPLVTDDILTHLRDVPLVILDPVPVQLGAGPHGDAADLLAPLLHNERLSGPVTHQEPDTVILHDATNLGSHS